MNRLADLQRGTTRKPQPRRILFLVHGIGEVSCRFRVLQYLPYLQRQGIEARVSDLAAPPLRRLRTLRSAGEYDATCVHRAFLNPFEQSLLRRRARRYVFDFDDAIMFRDSSHRRLYSRRRRARFRRMVANADAAVAGNGYLASWVARYNRRVDVVPTPVDVEAYSTRSHADGEGRIGWIGTRINLPYLHSVAPALRRLTRRRPEVTLVVVSDGAVELPGIRVINKPWSLAEEAADLTSFGVGIMPLPDDPWTRGKCALKILQYFAAAVPVVCSPIGANLDVVDHGRDGYFATSEEEWIDRLDDLLGDTAKRDVFGRAGRRKVEQRYSVEVCGQQLIRTLLRTLLP